jgi:hypothetical protein
VKSPRKRCSPVTVPARVEGLDPDVVEVDRPVHRRARVGLGDDQDPLPRAPARPDAGRAERSGGRRGSGGVVAQQTRGPCPVTGLHHDRLAGLGLASCVLAVAEEGEVVGGHPSRRNRTPRRRPRRRRCPAGCGARARPLIDDGPVRCASSASPRRRRGRRRARSAHPAQRARLAVAPRRSPVDLPGASTTRPRRHPESLPGACCRSTSSTSSSTPDRVPADDRAGGGRGGGPPDARGEVSAGDGVDEERHVVGDDLDRPCAPWSTPPDSTVGVVDAHVRRANRPIMRGEVERCDSAAAQAGLPDGPREQVLGDDVPVVPRAAKAQRDPRNPSEPSPQRCAARCRETAQARWSW